MSDTLEEKLEKQSASIKKQLEQLRVDILQFRAAYQGVAVENLKRESERLSRDARSIIESQFRVKTSDYMLHFSIFISAIIGVLGNFFVSLWFLPSTPEYVAGLWLSSIILLALFCLIIYEIRKAKENLNKEVGRIAEFLVENPEFSKQVYGFTVERKSSSKEKQ